MTTVSRVAQFLTKFPNRNPNKILKNPNFNFHRTLTRMSQNPQNYSQTSNGGDDKHRINHFVLSSSSALKIQKGDITEWSIDGATDAIVNAANERMLGGGGVDGAIHRAAGPELRAACHSVPEVRPGVRCPTGEAKITPAFRLPVSHVIHTVGPIYNTHDHPEVLLRSSYRNCLRLAKENNIQYIAFPAISCGVYRYPIEEAATIALSTVKEFSMDFKEDTKWSLSICFSPLVLPLLPCWYILFCSLMIFTKFGWKKRVPCFECAGACSCPELRWWIYSLY